MPLYCVQVHSQLTPGGRRVFGNKFFKLYPIVLKYVKHFSRGDEIFSRGAFASLVADLTV